MDKQAKRMSLHNMISLGEDYLNRIDNEGMDHKNINIVGAVMLRENTTDKGDVVININSGALELVETLCAIVKLYLNDEYIQLMIDFLTEGVDIIEPDTNLNLED